MGFRFQFFGLADYNDTISIKFQHIPLYFAKAHVYEKVRGHPIVSFS